MVIFLTRPANGPCTSAAPRISLPTDLTMPCRVMGRPGTSGSPVSKMAGAAFKRILFLILTWSTQGSITAQPNPNPDPTLDASIVNEMSAQHFPGAVTVIVKDDRIVWMQGYGLADIANAIPVTDTTNFILASVSKLFTGTAAMQLIENDVIDLDDDVDDFLPWPVHVPGFPNDPITFRQLMTHSSSIQDDYGTMGTYYGYPDPTMTLADCMQRYFSPTGADFDPADNFIATQPGSVFEYSNMATALNGYLVEHASGIGFDPYCQTHIFEDLCMERTYWHIADHDTTGIARPYRWSGGNYIPYAHYGFADYPDGQLRSNARDLANFMIAYLNGGTFGTNTILTPASIDQMWTPQIPGIEDSQGLNWYKEVLFHSNGSAWVWGHNGGSEGASADLYLDPENGIGVCVLANGEGDGLGICDLLYDHAINLTSTQGITPDCLVTGTGTHEQVAGNKRWVRTIDVLGRETEMAKNTPLMKVFSDGSVERVLILE